MGHIMSPEKFISKFIRQLNYQNSEIVESLAKKIVAKLTPLMEGKRTSTTSGVALCYATLILGISSITISDVSRVSRVSENTLKGTIKKLSKKRDRIMTESELEHFKRQISKKI